MMKKVGFYLFMAGLIFLSACQKDSSDKSIPGLSDTDPFMTGLQKVDSLFTVNISANGYSNEELLMLTTLQGLVAKSSATQIYFYSTQDDFYYPPDDENNPVTRTSSLLIRHYLTTERNPNLMEVANPVTKSWQIVDYFKQYISGYILYDDSGDGNYRNMAVTYASIMNCIPVNFTMEDSAIAHNLTIKGDVIRFTSYMDFYNQNKNDITPNFCIELDPTIYQGPRDYAAMLGGMIFWTPGDANTRTSLMNAINPGVNPTIPVFGWDDHDASQDIAEYNFVNSVCLDGNFVVASDNSVNLSLLSSLNTTPVKVPDLTPALLYDSSKVYVTFIMSDGDNLQLMTTNVNTKVWYGSPYRGDFPVGWSLPPAMFYMEPDVWNLIMGMAKPSDEFILGPSTIGYTMGNVTNHMSSYNSQIHYMNTFLNKSGIKVGMVFGDHVKTPDDYTGNYAYLDSLANSDLEGLFYRAYNGGVDWRKHIFINGKPVAYFNLDLNPSEAYNAGDLHQQVEDRIFDLTQVMNYPTLDYGNGFYPVYGVRNFRKDTDFDTRNLMGAFHELYNGIQDLNADEQYKDRIVVVKPTQFISLMKQAYQKNPGRWITRQ